MDQAWKRFERSGSVTDYLRYKQGEKNMLSVTAMEAAKELIIPEEELDRSDKKRKQKTKE